MVTKDIAPFPSGALGQVMQIFDSGSCRTSNAPGQAAATQGWRGFHGSLQDRADQLVRATVLSDLGQDGRHHHRGHGIQAVAGAIFRSLSAQDVTGTDAADDVLKKIETSLHKAAQALADRGVDAKTIDATIDKFRSQLANALDAMSGASGAVGASGAAGASGSGSAAGSSGPGGASSTGSSGTNSSAGASGADGSSDASSSAGSAGSTTAPIPPATGSTSVSQFVAREVRKERGAIDLVTAEGDRVSIRFRTKEVISGSVTQATGADGTSVTAARSSVFERGGVKIEVDGDLNEDELAAIGDLLGKVDDIATKFFSGDVQAAFTAASSLGVDSDQIAAYRLNLTYSRKIAAVYAAVGASAPASTTQPPASTPAGNATTPSAPAQTPGAASAASDPSASSPAPASDGTSSTAAATDPSSNDSAQPSTAGSAGTSDTTPTAGSTGTPASTPPASAQKTIVDFLNDALSKLASANGAGRITFSMHWKVHMMMTVLQSVQPAQPATAADQTATNTRLLSDSLQKIAAA